MSEKADKTVYRHELKYFVSTAQIEVLKNRISGIMCPDPHIFESGRYSIRSVYFDDYQNRCFYENENGNDPRAKYRIRIYNQCADRISLELKQKEKGRTRKTSCLLTIEQTEVLLKGNYLSDIAEKPKLLQALCADIMVNRLCPVVIVEYDRYPYLYKNGNVRITFDTCISSSKDVKSFFQNSIPKRSILPKGLQLLEVKFDGFLPDIIYRALQLDDLQQTAFSKYYLCRKYTI